MSFKNLMGALLDGGSLVPMDQLSQRFAARCCGDGVSREEDAGLAAGGRNFGRFARSFRNAVTETLCRFVLKSPRSDGDDFVAFGWAAAGHGQGDICGVNVLLCASARVRGEDAGIEATLGSLGDRLEEIDTAEEVDRVREKVAGDMLCDGRKIVTDPTCFVVRVPW